MKAKKIRARGEQSKGTKPNKRKKRSENKRGEERSLTEYWLMVWRWNDAENLVSVLFC